MINIFACFFVLESPNRSWIATSEFSFRRCLGFSFILYLSFFTHPFLGGLGFLSLSLGVTTLYITPVLVHFICKGARITLLVFRRSNPTYNPSYVILYGKDAATLVLVCTHCLACSQQ